MSLCVAIPAGLHTMNPVLPTAGHLVVLTPLFPPRASLVPYVRRVEKTEPMRVESVGEAVGSFQTGMGRLKMKHSKQCRGRRPTVCHE
jgi:hypothetical protein